MAERLNHSAGRTARSDQVLGRGVTQIDDALSEHDAAGWPIGEIGALGRDLGRQAEGVRRAGAGDLHL